MCLSCALTQTADKDLTVLMSGSCSEVSMSKIDHALLKQLEEAEKAGRTMDIPVIVTLIPGVEAPLIEQCGLKRISRHVPLYAGRLPAAGICEMARRDDVERIEYDDKAWAL